MCSDYPLEWIDAKWSDVQELIFNKFKDDLVSHGADPKEVSKLSLEDPETEQDVLRWEKDIVGYTGMKYVRKGRSKNG